MSEAGAAYHIAQTQKKNDTQNGQNARRKNAGKGTQGALLFFGAFILLVISVLHNQFTFHAFTKLKPQ